MRSGEIWKMIPSKPTLYPYGVTRRKNFSRVTITTMKWPASLREKSSSAPALMMSSCKPSTNWNRSHRCRSLLRWRLRARRRPSLASTVLHSYTRATLSKIQAANCTISRPSNRTQPCVTVSWSTSNNLPCRPRKAPVATRRSSNSAAPIMFRPPTTTSRIQIGAITTSNSRCNRSST